MDDVQQLTGAAGATAAGQVLGRAFLEDPVFAWLVRGADRERRLVRVFTAFAAEVARTPGSRILVTRDRTGAALWLPPGRWRGGVGELVRGAPCLLSGVRGGVLRGLRLQAAVEAAHPRPPHWYLTDLGAVATARGRGVGARLVQPVLDLCDEQQLPAYLESSNPRNWSFYERHGFVRRDPIAVPRGCPLLVPMWREPR